MNHTINSFINTAPTINEIVKRDSINTPTIKEIVKRVFATTNSDIIVERMTHLNPFVFVYCD